MARFCDGVDKDVTFFPDQPASDQQDNGAVAILFGFPAGICQMHEDRDADSQQANEHWLPLPPAMLLVVIGPAIRACIAGYRVTDGSHTD